ncbi:MAG TPA: membrane dipeptidase [Candidatus Sulfotelmatobacter sp.]|nr:membrane dipeptidase [Candidatus Sulfotelmatobacter sp.]
MTSSDAKNVSEKVRAICHDAILWDMVFQIDPAAGNTYESLSRFKNSGFSHVSLTLAGDSHNTAEAVAYVGRTRRELNKRGDWIRVIERADEIAEAKRSGQLGVVLHFEGTRPFERNLDMIDIFYKLGIRHALLAFNQANDVGGGCAERVDGGLSRFGSRLIQEMQRVGMLVDLSHTGYKTSLDAIAVSTHPVVFTHSNASVLHPHFRNIRDDQIKACAETGGVVGVSGATMYLGTEKPTSEAIFRQIDYFVELVGADHVGFGFDTLFDGSEMADFVRQHPDEWPDTSGNVFEYSVPEQVTELVGCMLNHGYSEGNIRKIAGQNWVRVCKSVWK